MPEIISVECRGEFDPKIIRVTFHLGLTDYIVDFPCELYQGMQAQFGWPNNPCGSC